MGIILVYEVDYYKICDLGFPLTLFVFYVFGIFRGMQNTVWPMVISITGALLNVVLDFVLVYGIEDIIPAYHIKGAAYASVIAQLVMALMALVLMLKKTPFSLRLQLPFNKELKRLISLSFNLFIRTLALNIALYLSNAYATKYGNAYIAAQTIAFQIWLFFAFFIDGYSSVGNIISGRLLGENNFKTLKILSKDLSKYAVIAAMLLALICIFYQNIGRLFTSDAGVIQIFESVFWIVLLMQPLNAIAFVFDGIFKGLAEAKTLRNTIIKIYFFWVYPDLAYRRLF